MSNNKNIPTQVSQRALEMIMRDVLDCLQEASLESALQKTDSRLRIIQTSPLKPRDQSRKSPGKVQIEAEIIQFPQIDKTMG